MYLPLTQDHIGDATGLTFVHVNRILRTLRKEGVVEFHHRRLRILDPDRLVRVAGVDHNAAMAWICHAAARDGYCVDFSRVPGFGRGTNRRGLDDRTIGDERHLFKGALVESGPREGAASLLKPQRME